MEQAVGYVLLCSRYDVLMPAASNYTEQSSFMCRNRCGGQLHTTEFHVNCEL